MARGVNTTYRINITISSNNKILSNNHTRKVDSMSKAFFDTSALLACADCLDEFRDFYISSTTLKELENIKKSSHKDDVIKYKARCVIRYLNDNPDRYLVVLTDNKSYELLGQKNLEVNHDNLIIADAYSISKLNDIVFVTDDLACKIIASKMFGLNVKSADEYETSGLYLGWREVVLDDYELAVFYENKENMWNLKYNEYLIIKDSTDKVIDLWRFTQDGFVAVQPLKIKDFRPLNYLQYCALDLMGNEVPIKILLGRAGTGKTIIAVNAGLHLIDKGKFERIVLIRNPVGKGEKIGYLPGSKLEKMSVFMKGLLDNLDGGEQQYESLLNQDKLRIECPYYLKGASIQSSWIIVDEAEDMDVDIIKLVGSRVGKESMICFTGDLTQTERQYKNNNGIMYFINKYAGHPLVGMVVLQDDVRSEVSSLFADL